MTKWKARLHGEAWRLVSSFVVVSGLRIAAPPDPVWWHIVLLGATICLTVEVCVLRAARIETAVPKRPGGDANES